MVLPPCHCLAQFYVNANGELSSQLYQRSGDLGLGVPFNIASYALLTCMLAHITNLKLGEFVHTLGDCHVYEEHIDSLKIQLAREPRKFPTLTINDPKIKNIDDFRSDHFVINDYLPHDGAIALKLVV